MCKMKGTLLALGGDAMRVKRLTGWVGAFIYLFIFWAKGGGVNLEPLAVPDWMKTC